MQTVSVTVHPSAKENRVEKKSENIDIYTISPAHLGKANQSVIKLLSQYFGVSKSKIIILKGEKSKTKQIGVIHD